MRYICSSKDHGYRDSTNPLRGLNMSRLVGLQESGERGDYADLQWFYYYMERSDAMIHSVIQRRRAALLSLDWDVRVVSQSKDDPRAQEQADFLRKVYDNIDNFREDVSFLFTGFFRGFAHLEKHWTPNQSGVRENCSTRTASWDGKNEVTNRITTAKCGTATGCARSMWGAMFMQSCRRSSSRTAEGPDGMNGMLCAACSRWTKKLIGKLTTWRGL